MARHGATAGLRAGAEVLAAQNPERQSRITEHPIDDLTLLADRVFAGLGVVPLRPAAS